MATAEFLPLCDVLFNIVSLASYFCDVVFDLLTVYTLFASRQLLWFWLALTAVVSSLVVCQVLSARWYSVRDRHASAGCGRCVVVCVHVALVGVLWRHCRLLVPVDGGRVKQQVRDLCVLRMVHAFCQAVPMLLLQLYLVLRTPPAPASPPQPQVGSVSLIGGVGAGGVSDLSVVSTALSLFSVCWALASYGKNARQRNVHRLVLTWLGVIFQLLWRLGTVTARVLALALYGTQFGWWAAVVIALHWLAMLLWLVSPSQAFDGGERTPLTKRLVLAAAVAYVYTFCYVNLQECRSRVKTATFYAVMLVENLLLVCVTLAVVRGRLQWQHYALLAVVLASFTAGVGFMALYYRYFHISKLAFARSTLLPSSGASVQQESARHGVPVSSGEVIYANLTHMHDTRQSHAVRGGQGVSVTCGVPIHAPANGNGVVSGGGGGGGHMIGVFNCRFNPALAKRKKKKPTTFVPPAVAPPMPFWRRPLPSVESVAATSTAGGGLSDVDAAKIQEKLREKRRQQLAELRAIQLEIAEGKLVGPAAANNTSDGVAGRPAAPAHKWRPWPPPPQLLVDSCGGGEVVLTAGRLAARATRRRHRVAGAGMLATGTQYQSVRAPPSDVDSRVSLPRCNTLPRHFCHQRSTRHDSDDLRPTGAPMLSDLSSGASSDNDGADSERDVEAAVLARNNLLLQQQAVAARLRSQHQLQRRLAATAAGTEHETQL